MQPDSTSTDTSAEQAPATDTGTAAEPATTPEPTTSEAGDTTQAPDNTGPFGPMDHAAYVLRDNRHNALAHAVATVHKLIDDGWKYGVDADERIIAMADRFEAWLTREVGAAPSTTSTPSA